MKIGVFFGGQSREREISFAGGRTVFDNLNKDLFEAVPIFIDSLGNFILLDWHYLYKGTIRDFYPPTEFVDTSDFQLYIESLENIAPTQLEKIITSVGRAIQPSDFKRHFDFAFLALHGTYGEDGAIQGLLEWYGIPYSGCGILPSSIGIDKIAQDKILSSMSFERSTSTTIRKSDWLNEPHKGDLLENLVAKIGLPMVFKAPHQGSSIGVNILTQKDNNLFQSLVDRTFFTQTIYGRKWIEKSDEDKHAFVTMTNDIREGLGFPLEAIKNEQETTRIFHPNKLLDYLNELDKKDTVTLSSIHSEEEILVERFILGQEFSCIVIQDDQGQPIALPPTQIIKSKDLFDYRMKYLPGMSRKVTPIDLPADQVQDIREACTQLFDALQGEVYMRIDGFVDKAGKIYLNDPNTTSGMLPSSFFFHQAAEIGLGPSQFLTYIIRTSLKARAGNSKKSLDVLKMLETLDQKIIQLKNTPTQKTKVAVIMGGYSSERHISVESGRNVYEKLASSSKYTPIPIFLTGSDDAYRLYEIPINIMLKDNADDIRDKILQAEQGTKNPVATKILQGIIDETNSITSMYSGQDAIFDPRLLSFEALADRVDVVFIALHGRPGEDGSLQAQLDKVGLRYNGSSPETSQVTINKYETNERLKGFGLNVAQHRLISRADWESDATKVCEEIEKEYQYPIICKPVDDGCSSAVKKIKDRAQLMAFASMTFRPTLDFLEEPANVLDLKASEEFPLKDQFLVEELIHANGAKHFLEITGGILLHRQDDDFRIEIFEASETLATGEVLSLEEKFLAGEGQNITPARYDKDPKIRDIISAQVAKDYEVLVEKLGIRGYSRIDAFVRIFEDNTAETIFIEVNTLPGMTPATCIFHQAAINNMKPFEFIDKILTFALDVNNDFQPRQWLKS